MLDFVLFVSKDSVANIYGEKDGNITLQKHTTNVFLNVNFWYPFQQITKIRISLEHIVKKCSIRENAAY